MDNVIIFGEKNPKLNFVSSRYFSRSNYNIFLSDDEYKYVSYGKLLSQSNEPLNTNNITSELFSSAIKTIIFAPEICFQCAESTLACPLLIKSTDEEIIKEPENLKIKWWRIKNEIEILDWENSCPFFHSFMDLPVTIEEKKFLRLYLSAQLQKTLSMINEGIFAEARSFLEYNANIIYDILRSRPSKRVPNYKGWGRERGGAPSTLVSIKPKKYDRSSLLKKSSENVLSVIKYKIEDFMDLPKEGFSFDLGTANNLSISENYELGKWLRKPLFDIPALIPQAWLRYIHDDKLRGAKDPLKDLTFSCVDFLIIWNNQKIVIEIDGQPHFAEFNRSKKKWEPSLKKYTENLIKERKIKKQGFRIFRISDIEIDEAQNWEDLDDILELEETLGLWDIDNLPNYIPHICFFN